MPKSQSAPEGRNWLSLLCADETRKVRVFFKNRYWVDDGFWLDKVLYKKVHSVWVCSRKAWELQKNIRCESVGVMLLQELESLKPAKPAEVFFKKVV